MSCGFVLLLFLQLQLHMPPALQITTNDSTLSFSKEWLAGILSNLPHRQPQYAIVAFYASQNVCYTKLRIPQTANRTQVIENIILYYLLMQKEEDRCSEILLIYPYFVPVTQHPFVTARYLKGGQIVIHFNQWETVQPPPEPSPKEKQIYNFILQKYFEHSSTMDVIPDSLFQIAARRFSLSTAKIKTIYQNVFLWQKQF